MTKKRVAGVLGVAITALLCFFWYREVAFTDQCQQRLKALSTEVCIAVDNHGGLLPRSLTFTQVPQQCPKTGHSYQYETSKEKMFSIEDGYGFAVSCPDRHYSKSLQAIRLSYDASHSNVPVKTETPID